ncbi:hypothetical protein VNI00_004449 [Paramarasmius palmivorus]|uniref:DUF6534 domain-containing protein n=1 Tax=Paramarasmius palmivorus TaxID=297713 RepID=A0AAW0DJV0_9AGAR
MKHRIGGIAPRAWLMMITRSRQASASGTTAQMLKLRSFERFKHEVHWLFTLGLALSCMVDVLITGSLFFLLQTSRSDAGNLNAVIDTLIIYTFETGSITAAATIVSMICWIAMPTNLIFMGLHFVIVKFYANSFLVTLNTRRNLREQSYQSEHRLPGLVLTSRTRRSESVSHQPSPKATELQINVERSVQYTTDYSIGLPDRDLDDRPNFAGRRTSHF